MVTPFAFWLGYKVTVGENLLLRSAFFLLLSVPIAVSVLAAAIVLQIHPLAFQHAQNSSNS